MEPIRRRAVRRVAAGISPPAARTGTSARFYYPPASGSLRGCIAGADAPPWRRIAREPLTRVLSTYPIHAAARSHTPDACVAGQVAVWMPSSIGCSFRGPRRYAGMHDGSQIPILERHRIPCGYVRRASAASGGGIHVKHLNDTLIIGKIRRTKDYWLGCAHHRHRAEWDIQGSGARYAPHLRVSDPRGATRPCSGGAD